MFSSRTVTMQLQTLMLSSGFERRPYVTAVSGCKHYTGWAASDISDRNQIKRFKPSDYVQNRDCAKATDIIKESLQVSSNMYHRSPDAYVDSHLGMDLKKYRKRWEAI
ncbi:hypothetical protein TNCV_217641 [Trichonephila clavipes]|nr:hypothetical protein TNCV_217641 [Trichonephila clavipes]